MKVIVELINPQIFIKEVGILVSEGIVGNDRFLGDFVIQFWSGSFEEFVQQFWFNVRDFGEIFKGFVEDHENGIGEVFGVGRVGKFVIIQGLY